MSSSEMEIFLNIIILIVYFSTLFITVGISVLFVVCYWKVFKKAGYEGWEALIPFYNSYILSEMTLGKGIYFLILMIPCLGFIVMYVMFYRLGQAFGKSTGFNIGLLLLPIVFLPILAFEKNSVFRKLPPLF